MFYTDVLTQETKKKLIPMSHAMQTKIYDSICSIYFFKQNSRIAQFKRKLAIRQVCKNKCFSL